MPGLISSCTRRLRRGMLIVFFCLLLIIGGTLLLTRQPMADIYSVPEGAEPIAASPDNTGCVVIVCRYGAER